jgi:hypothetical protein
LLLTYLHRETPDRGPAGPRFLVAPPNYAERPIQLLWYDVETMSRLLQIEGKTGDGGSAGGEDAAAAAAPAPLVVAYQDEDDDDDSKDDPSKSYPRRPDLRSLQEFKTSPAIHAAYAVTWFGLSLLGTAMTRRLYLGRPGW